MEVFKYQEEFELEVGEKINGLEIAYHTYGTLNEARDNVIWVCHAFTANSDVADWWPGMVGDGLLMDTSKYFIVCANVLGSCYGSTGPSSINPDTGKPYHHSFPQITVRDVVNTLEILRQELKISSIELIIGGSIGAFQAIEWTIMFPDVIKNMVFIGSNAKASPWGIAINESQRLALQADPTFTENSDKAGLQGLKAARSIALLSYRNSHAYNTTQQDPDEEKLSGYRATTYQQYQGEKLIKRYTAISYKRMLDLFDSHNVGRGRGGVEKALSTIKAKSLIIGITSDYLFPPNEQKELIPLIPDSEYAEITSAFGHDGFLLEIDQLTQLISKLLSKNGN